MKRLRKSIRLMALLLVVMILLPIGYGAYSLMRYGTRWRTSEHNTYLSALKNSVTAGDIRDRNGVLLAQTDEGGARAYHPDAAVRRAVVHVVGDAKGNVKNAAENFMAEYIYGANMGYFERLSQQLTTKTLRGDDIVLSIDSALCKRIAQLFPQDRNGAVIVMNYRTGEVHALMSFPAYDPQGGAAVTVRQATNRATRWLSAPGSVFKIVTLASALQNMPDAQSRSFVCTGGVFFDEHERVVTDYGGTAHGSLSLRDAFAQSCNSTFAMLAVELGDRALRKTAAGFGVGDDFTFRDLVVENSAFANTDNTLMGADLAWTGDGQNELGLTPLHMCMIAASVANNGVMMEPRLLLSATSAAGKQRVTAEPAVYRTALTPQDAATIRDLMRVVVTQGTGTAAAVSNVTICGKTGTAEMDTQEADNAWFAGFIADDEAPYAVCVAVEQGGTGGAVAAPIAREIFKALLGR